MSLLLSPPLLLSKAGLQRVALAGFAKWLRLYRIGISYRPEVQLLQFLESGVPGFLPKPAALEYQSLWLLSWDSNFFGISGPEYFNCHPLYYCQKQGSKGLPLPALRNGSVYIELE